MQYYKYIANYLFWTSHRSILNTLLINFIILTWILFTCSLIYLTVHREFQLYMTVRKYTNLCILV